MRTRKALATIFVGLVIAVVGSIIWSVLLSTNLALTASVPWSPLVAAFLLVLAWSYLAGWGPPGTTKAIRSASIPRAVLTRRQWSWALTAGAGAMAANLCALLVAFRFLPIPISSLPDAARSMPLLTTAYLVSGSVVTSVIEEVAFRAYMQTGLRRVYGRTTAFSIVAIAFALIHAGNVEFLYLIPSYFITSLVLSLLVELSGSVWPGLVAHALADTVSLGLLLFVGEEALGAPASIGAIDTEIVVLLGAGLISIVVSALAFTALSKASRSPPIGAKVAK